MRTFTTNKGIGCIALALGISVAVLAATPAKADHSGGSFSFGLSSPGYYYSPPPTYYYAPPAPRYYYAPPTYYSPPPTYYYAPPPAYYYEPGPSFGFGLSIGSHR